MDRQGKGGIRAPRKAEKRKGVTSFGSSSQGRVVLSEVFPQAFSSLILVATFMNNKRLPQLPLEELEWIQPDLSAEQQTLLLMSA